VAGVVAHKRGHSGRPTLLNTEFAEAEAAVGYSPLAKVMSCAPSSSTAVASVPSGLSSSV